MPHYFLIGNPTLRVHNLNQLHSCQADPKTWVDQRGVGLMPWVKTLTGSLIRWQNNKQLNALICLINHCHFIQQLCTLQSCRQ